MGNYESLISSFATVNEYIILDDDNKSITESSEQHARDPPLSPSRNLLEKLQFRFSRFLLVGSNRVSFFALIFSKPWVIRETVRITRRRGGRSIWKTKIFGRAKCERNDSLRRRREQDAISIFHLHIDGISKSYEYFTTLSVAASRAINRRRQCERRAPAHWSIDNVIATIDRRVERID